uniref:Uncharacterized protein n=1 Tax=Kalanchoe fedtschenkoi TaxID=63787 RepID=A0A7N1A5U2_KALFE
MARPTTFSDLSPDCGRLIFTGADKTELNAASLACRDFHHYANELVRELDLSRKSIPKLNSFARLLRRFPNVKRLSLYPPPGDDLDATLHEIANSGLNLDFLCLPGRVSLALHDFPAEPLARLSSSMPNLKSLDCGHFVNGDDDLTMLAGMFPALEELDMSDCGSYVTDQGVDAAFKRLANLRKIDISFNGQMSDEWLKSLSTNCPLLEEVTCVASRRRAYWVTESGVCALLGGCGQLRSVRLGDINFSRSDFPLARAVCASASKKLMYLEIDCVVMVDDKHCCRLVDTEEEEACAARMKVEFFSAWDKLHGESY